jgi:PleD family two-component response regulator
VGDEVLKFVATLVENDDTMDSIIKRADALLYASKAAGRDCLSMG